MELDTPTFVRGVLREHDLPHGVTDRVLPSGIGADLAAKHADRIGPLLQGTVIPVLDGGEAEADGLAGGGMLPCAPGQLLDRGLQLAFGGRRRQQLSDDGEAQVRPPLVNSGTSCLSCHAGAPLAESSNRKSSTGWLATSVLCGYGKAVIERACGPQ